MNHVDGVNEDMVLLDIAWENLFPSLLGKTDTVNTIPHHLVPQSRKVYNFVMDKVQLHRNDTDPAVYTLWWKKLLLLPTILFSRESNKIRQEKVKLVLEDNWSFKLSTIPSRKVGPNRRRNTGGPTLNHHSFADDQSKFSAKDLRVYELCQYPELSKAYSTLVDTNSPVTPGPEAFAKLQSKHPQDNLLYGGDAATFNSISGFEVPEENRIHVSRETAIEFIRKTRVSVKPGLDKLKNKHLKQLIGSKTEANNDEEFEFAERLASILEDIANDNVPREVSKTLSSNEIFAAPKKNGDVRPIGIGFTLRKLAAKPILRETRGYNTRTSPPFNMAWPTLVWKRLFISSPLKWGIGLTMTC
jgi:hypothetical protein